MQLTDSEILEKLLGYLDVSQKEFAEQISSHQSLISKILKGERELSKENIRNISKCYSRISVRWLLMGEGSMLNVDGEHPLTLMEPTVRYGNALEMSDQEMRQHLARVSMDVQDLKMWKEEMDMWMEAMVNKLRGAQ